MGKRELTSSAFLFIIFLMKTLLSFYNTHKKNFYLATGILFSCLFMIPFLLLGTGSVITYHDQLDGELFNYILAARYLFTDIRIYPELMNGLPSAGAVVPAPLFVILYIFFKPFTAFMFSQWIIYLVGFIGMYLLLLKLTGREFISFGISVIFMLLPFYPVYGLCIPGQPLLCYAVLSLYQRESLKQPPHNKELFPPKMRHLFYYLLIFLYGASSSPVLVGFACLLVLGLFAAAKSIAALRLRKKIPLSPWLSLGVLLGAYIVFNFALIKQVLSPETSYISHKVEMVLSASEPYSFWKKIFTTGLDYAQSFHMILFLLMALCLFLMSFFFKKGPDDFKNLFFSAVQTLLFILLICLFCTFYHGNFMTQLRNSSNSILKTFNFDRISWLLPTAWCILAAYLLNFIMNFFKDKPASASLQHTASSRPLRFGIPLWRRILRQGIIFATLGLWGITVLPHSAIYPNLSKVIKGGNYYALDWNCFFAEDIFSQIEASIGMPQEDYRVVSIGIYPIAAAYNGFYCLDGYSNNYPLNYKHTFRQIIEGELDKNNYVRGLFDDWGNRCYITTAEQSNYYTFEKKWNSVIYDLDLNTDVLKELNCQYVFSAAYLMNAEEIGLSLLQEAPFETENSWYHIYVYKVE